MSAIELFSKNTRDWFLSSVGTPTLVQEEGWPSIESGSHTLISAPTGTGKTLAAFLVYIDRLKALAARGELEDELHLVYISPLKALGNDIRENLKRPLEGIGGGLVRSAVRTGDTTQAERNAMYRCPPHILITTPESLYLLLTGAKGRTMLKSASAVIIDELHSMINGKRGAHLMLSLARLDRLCGRRLQRIGLSATIEPLDVAADYLAYPEKANIIAPSIKKDVDIEVNTPVADMKKITGTIWPELGRAVYDHCMRAGTVILFVEGRRQAENIAYHVNLIAGDGFAKTHHGSVSKEQRLEAENDLRSGKLKLLCATSSMELGIDVGDVDLVLQIGFPRTISSTMQRLGRAGHNPGRTSVMHMLPRMASDCVYCGLTAKVAMEGGIEYSAPPNKCLDVLAQQLVAMAVGEMYTVDDAMEIMGGAYNFREVTRDELESVLKMLAGDYEHELDRPVRPRILYDRIHGTIEGDNYSRMLAISTGGTIPDRGMYSVRLPDGTKLGELDEEFVFEARVGDKFFLGAYSWRIEAIRKDDVIVTETSSSGAQPPFWKGDWTGRSYQTSVRFGRIFRELDGAYRAGRLRKELMELRLDEAAADNAADLLARQIEATGCLPDHRTIIVEHFRDQAGENQMMVHSVFGRRVNAGLVLLMEEAVKRATGLDTYCFEDDEGFLVQPYNAASPLPDGLIYLIDPDSARTRLAARLPETPAFNISFRYNAARALMIGMGGAGKGRLPLWIQRLRGAQALDSAIVHRDHPLVRETKRECMEDVWDLEALETVLRSIKNGEIHVREVRNETPSPFSLPLRREAEGTLMYEYVPKPTRVNQAVADALDELELIQPSADQLERTALRAREPESPAMLHSMMMAEGDLIAGEIEAPAEWLDSLAREERVTYIEPGLWICAEHMEDYSLAFEQGDRDMRRRLVRRLLRYRGAQDAVSVSERYLWDAEHCGELLEELVAEGVAVRSDELYYHSELYSRARRETIAQRRRQAVTNERENYQALLCKSMRISAPPDEQLERSLEMLTEQPFPPAMWESVLLPARVAGYRPELLDRLLSRGGIYWKFSGEERQELAFYSYEDIDWDTGFLADSEAGLSPEEEAIIGALRQRGASFAQALSGALAGLSDGLVSPLDILLGLAVKGLVRADSFAPVRRIIDGEKVKKATARQRVRSRVMAMEGRWELTRPLKSRSDEEKISRAFDRTPLLCRETVSGISWREALETLRLWEYTGRARRGYYIRGLSGAQFIRDSEYHQVTHALDNPSDEILWLNAADPHQQWGKALEHLNGRSLICVQGSAVCLRGGLPVAVLEQQGGALRVFDEDCLEAALRAFAGEYTKKRLFPGLKRITVKKYPEHAGDALAAAGFTMQMQDYVLWQS